MVSLSVFVNKLIVWIIYIYQIGISPLIGHRCRFSVTCSQYGINAIRRFGVFKGSWKACIRILRCHPLSIINNKK